MNTIVDSPHYAENAYNQFIYQHFGAHVPKLARPSFEAACGGRIARNLADAYHPDGPTLDEDDLAEAITCEVSLWAARIGAGISMSAWILSGAQFDALRAAEERQT